MAARAEGFRIPTAEDAVSEQMFAITCKVVEQTLNQNANYQPIVTEQVDDWLGWLKSRPEAIRQACELRHNPQHQTGLMSQFNAVRSRESAPVRPELSPSSAARSAKQQEQQQQQQQQVDYW